nr:chemotaxis protein CheC [uncultured Sulfurimonas sp.]
MSATFNTDQIETLKEFMNISLGEATLHVAELLDAFGTMHIPKISIRNTSELQNIIVENLDNKLNYYVAKQLFAGKFGGECVFIVSDESAKNLGSYLYNQNECLKSDITDAVMELTNIVTSSIISRLTQELNIQVQFFAPSCSFNKISNAICKDEITTYSKIIVVSTEMEFKNQNISAHIFILTKNQAIVRLKELIDEKIKEMYS